MHKYGFSTGALAFGEFRRGLELLSGHDATAVELSALRDRELPELMRVVDDLDLSQYEYISVHAPSRFTALSEARCAELLSSCIDRGWPVILHPDAIRDAGCWDGFGSTLCLENMDKRKSDGRSPAEMGLWFERFPHAGFCLDLAHARQLDPSLTIARQLIQQFRTRLQQVHLSELDVACHHRPLSWGSIVMLRELAHLLSPVAVILESCVESTGVAAELRCAREMLEPATAASQSSAR